MCAVTFPPSSKERADYFEKAMTALRYAVSVGYDDWHYIEVDADFDPLRECPEFQQALKEWKAGSRNRK